MKIVWDEPKRQRNLRARGLDFADVDLEFFAASTMAEAKNGRSRAIGEFRGKIVTVIFKPLAAKD